MVPFPRFMMRSQMTELKYQCLADHEAIKQLQHAKHRKIEEQEIAQCATWLGHAEKSINQNWVYYGTFDEAWSALQEIRHKLCSLLPLDELQRVVADVKRDIDDYVLATGRKAFQDSIKDVDEKLRSLLKGHADEQHKQEHFIRSELLRLSFIGAAARQQHWLRVNVFRDRLATTAEIVFVVTVLGALFIALPGHFGIPDLPVIPAASRPTILGVLFFGAAGGFLSGLLRRELLTGKSVAFYVEHMLMGLRPIVGAITALVLYLALRAGILNLFLPQSGSQSSEAFFFVAFWTGFSQQFFLKQVTSILQQAKKKGKSTDGEDAQD